MSRDILTAGCSTAAPCPAQHTEGEEEGEAEGEAEADADAEGEAEGEADADAEREADAEAEVRPMGFGGKTVIAGNMVVFPKVMEYNVEKKEAFL